MLSVVMATFGDFKETVFTVMNALSASRVVDEVVVVNNNPSGSENSKLKDFLRKSRMVKYVELASPQGTAAPRDLAIRSSKNKYVVCVDSHIQFRVGALPAIDRFWQVHQDKQNDLVQGPILNESMEVMATSFKDVWGVDVTPQSTRYSEMWGQWHKDVANGKPRHEVEPFFEIPAQGLGLFSVNRESWLGFNPHMTGFGGEEFYIHEKYRKMGRKCWCLSQLQWWHLFGEPKTYPLQRGHKCRNYVLGLTELGIPLDRAHEHFVKSNLIPQDEWNRYVAEANTLHPKPATASSNPIQQPIQVQNTRISRSNFPALQAAATAARAYRLQHPCGELGLPLENTGGCRGMKKHKCGKALHGGAVCPAAECIACASYDDVGPASTEADA